MNVRRHLWLAPMILALLLAACVGGSGSSGFDISENFAIEQALDSQECVDFEGLIICPAAPAPTAGPTITATPTFTATPAPPEPTPSFTPTPPTDVPLQSPSPTLPEGFQTPGPSATVTPRFTETGTPTVTVTRPAPETPFPTAPPIMEIETSLSDAGAINCPSLPVEIACPFDFAFTPRGFPADATYRVAVREAVEMPWTILPVPQLIPQEREPAFASFFEIDRSASPGAPLPALQFAVLVFLGPADGLPAQVQRLGDTGADFAYVTPVVSIAPGLRSVVGLRVGTPRTTSSFG
jgi:hypothetical protein